MPKAQWTTNPREVTSGTGTDGTFRLRAPLLDGGILQGYLVMEITEDRELVFTWEAEPNAEGLTDFRAWSKEA